MSNIPDIKIGIVAVSRDCFPAPLAVNRRKAVVEAYVKNYSAKDIYECPITIVESEIDMVNALEDVKKNNCNALCVYLGNFGPEIAETLLAKHFDGPVMFSAAAEESQDALGIHGRGDAYCGMLNASYNLALRNVNAWIPENPTRDAVGVAENIHDFIPIARVKYGLEHLKIITFGPRPQNFLACNAPIRQLYNMNIEIEEESELDLFEAYEKHYCPEKYNLDEATVKKQNARIAEIKTDMMKELGLDAPSEKQSAMLDKFAAYEATLLDWIDEHKGYRKYVALATKCWPAFEDMFKFVPCYVNSRLTGRGIPVSCEVDIYGALSEYIGWCVSEHETTLLDINNSVPFDMYEQSIKGKFAYDYKPTDVFMGFHCGNTCSKRLVNPHIGYQQIMANTHPQEWCDGTMEGDIQPGEITFYRVQSKADATLRAYIAQGEVLPVATRSFGSIGVFAIKEMGRFYRYELIGNNYPHHGAVMFGHYGKTLYEALKFIGLDPKTIGYNRPAGSLYDGENPWGTL